MAGNPQQEDGPRTGPMERTGWSSSDDASSKGGSVKLDEPASPTTSTDLEKAPSISPSSSSSIVDNEEIPDDDPRVKDLPPLVRKMVSLTDDPTLPVVTFRYFVLSVLFVVPGAFLSQMNHFRTTAAPYSIFFVQIACSYLGDWWAKTLPAWQMRVPRTRWSWSLNPGPFSVKEHVLVVLTAAAGATANLGAFPISMADLYFDHTVNPAVAIFFMWAIVWTGYSFAAIGRQFLIYDPQYPWFHALCQTSLFEAQKKQRDHPTPQSRKQARVFWIALMGITLWQFLPEYAFPMLGSLAFLCWVAPENPTANFISSGFGGMGFLNLSFDWSTISNTSHLFITPWWTQVISFIAFVISTWILLPWAKFGGLGQENGTMYPVTKLITPEATFNETAYNQLGPVFVSTQVLWGMFFEYAAFISALVWMLLFGWNQITTNLSKLWARRKPGAAKISEQYTDQLNIIQRAYDEVPLWWFGCLFLISFVTLCSIIATGQLYIPLYTYFVAIITGAMSVIPLGWLYALSNWQVHTGTINDLVYGLMISHLSTNKNPVGASVYASIAGNAWYRALADMRDMKLGHYMHIPPRAVFFSQVFGSLIGIPINYGVVRWVLSTKRHYLTGEEIDPTHQWTAQHLASSLTAGVQYVLIGPARMFRQSLYSPLPYGFLLGAIVPPVIFMLHRRFPKIKFRLCNSTIFFSNMAVFHGNISAGYFSGFIGGFVVMFWAFRRRYEMWARWNYILAAAFDAGFNFNTLIIFLLFGTNRATNMPNWWGNDARNSERCFALDTKS